MIRLPRRAARALVTVAAGLAMAGGSLALAGAASAAPLPGPHAVFAPAFFTLNVPPGTGTAYGPVHGNFTDHEVSQTAGIWTFGFGPFTTGKVLVRHTEVTTPEVNPLSCRGFKVEEGRWILTGLTGRDRNAFGFGRFTAYVSDQGARNRDGRCEAERVISERVFVVGQGIATNPHRSFPHPYVAPVS